MKDLICARIACNWILFFNDGHYGLDPWIVYQHRTLKTLVNFILKPQNLLTNVLANVNILSQCHENLQLNYSGKTLGRNTQKPKNSQDIIPILKKMSNHI